MNAMSGVRQFFDERLPTLLTPEDHRLLARIGEPVALEVTDAGELERWVLLERAGELKRLDAETRSSCRFSLAAPTMLDIVAGRRTPPQEFFAGRIKIEGNVFLALKVGSFLGDVFRRSPWTPCASLPEPTMSPVNRPKTLTEKQRQNLALHLHPTDGAPYWVELATRRGIQANQLNTVDDLAVFGPMDREALCTRPFRDFVPRSIVSRSRIMMFETGGTTGTPASAVWTPEEFEAAFVRPLLEELGRRNVTGLRQWLFVGPTGPHIIGHAADALAMETTHCGALKVDFDPRWHRRLPPSSFSANRHISHIVEQAAHLLERERPDALFITPSILSAIAATPCSKHLRELRLLHLGGQSLNQEEYASLRSLVSPQCQIINGYGNSLFGCVVEDDAANPLTYPRPTGDMVLSITGETNTNTEVPTGQWGRVMFHRFGRSMMILNAFERDQALNLGTHFASPRPIEDPSINVAGAIY